MFLHAGATVACTALMLAAVPAAHAQRLPSGVSPEHYTLTLEPDLKAATFTGDETIDVVLAQPSDTITLNAAQITFKKVTITANGKKQKANVTLDADKEQAAFHVAHTLPAGKAAIHILYSGILNDQLRGFYLSKTAKRNYAVTQFEPTDARRAFPSFDEPALKATYTTRLIVDTGDTAISNTNIISDKPGPTAGKHTILFATTPRMSTYLVAFLVGDFKCVSGESDGVPIRACATPDKVQLGTYAVKAAEFVLHYYDNYFGIKYPMPKLDMIAIPDFEAGAMENFGAITYRESDFLIDEKTASVNAKKRVATVVAHEMAHQWFGDMVTMQWWNNLWLNEGFATWMENKPVAAWHPEWKIPQDEALDLDGILNVDAGKVTRTIRANADTPAQINEMFDGITYQKGGAVLAMVENYLGKETFRRGVHNYLEAHLYANATAEDFWNAQTETSGKPVDKVMDSFVGLPGVPLLHFSAPQNGTVQVSQQRFFLSPDVHADHPQTWTIPVCFKTADEPKCELLTSKQQTLTVPSSAIFYGNAGDKGYYRSVYQPADYQAIVAKVETGLTPTERIGFAGNEWALMRSGRGSVGNYLDLADGLKNDSNAAVIDSLAGSIAAIDARIATEQDRKLLAAWVRQQFGPAYDRVKDLPPTASLEQHELRATLFGVLGGIGHDPKIIAESKRLTEMYIQDPASVDPAIARTALAIATENGDSHLFDQLQALSQTSTNPDVQTAALFSLANFHDPALMKRALDYATSGKVRNQDSVFFFVEALRSRDTRPDAWQYIQTNWDKVHAQLTTMMGAYLVGSAGSFCSADKLAEVNSFFSTHKVVAADRALKRADNAIQDCITLRSAQQPNLSAWLAKQDVQATAGD
jgi:aminopeptidase N/puromycin-sensitive aminopeptidase